MLKPQRKQYDVFLKVRDFGKQHASLFPASSTAGKAFATICKALMVIDRDSSKKEVSRQQSRDACKAAKRDLLQRLIAIAPTARRATRVDGTTRAVFQVPRDRSNKSLLEGARRFVEAGTPVSHQWAELGLPKDTLANLQRSIDSLERTLAERSQGRNGAKSAGVRVQQAFAQALDALHDLDVIVVNTLADDAATLAVWQTSRGLAIKRPRRARSVDSTAAAPVVPTATTSASPPAPPAEPTPAPKPDQEPATV
jgi:hypothetical protein